MTDTARNAHQKTDFWAIWDEGEPAVVSAESDFVQSSLRAASHSRLIPRGSILNDVALLLDCCPRALEFLFEGPRSAANDFGPMVMPDYRHSAFVQPSLFAAE